MAENTVPADEATEEFLAGREVESLFGRDDNDVLIRREKETRERFKELVTVTIDGYPVEMPRAVPKTDSLGNPLRDASGELVPRAATIYDAAARLVSGYTTADGKRVAPVWTDAEFRERIPVLCHQQHLNPVAMCRLCSVHISSVKRGKLTPGRRLVPACQHRVEKDMVVTTRAGVEGYNPATRTKVDLGTVARLARDVDSAVKLLAEFLLADHKFPDPGTAPRFEDELQESSAFLDVADARDRLRRSPGLPSRNDTNRFSLPVLGTAVEAERVGGKEAARAWEDWNATIDAAYPYSSRSVVVDHDRCILCDRCVRSCSEVKPFKVIGHTGKGYGTRISFDLDALMGESSCVQCGECMTSCPTGALSLRRRVQPRAWPDSPDKIPKNPNTPFPEASGFLSADEVRDVWLLYHSPTRGPRVVFPFRSVPYSYLKWNEGAVRRWEIPPGESKVLCRAGEYGSTAFLLQGTGSFDIHAPAETHARPGFFARLLGRTLPDPDLGALIRTATGDELILGEMTCLTHRPRTASVVANSPPDNPALVLRYDANDTPVAVADGSRTAPVVVYEITRNLLDMLQRSGSARDDVREVYAFRAIQSCLSAGKMFARLSSAERDRAIRFLLAEGAEFRRVEANETVVAEGDPTGDFYIVRLGTVREFTTVGGRDQLIRLVSAGGYFGEATRPGFRPASVAALDPVELVRIPGPVFRRFVAEFPTVGEELAAPRTAVAGVSASLPAGVLGEYVQQGLFQGQRMLVLDLVSCTRCDECTRACADSHDGHARLLREGLRFGDFLVTTSCRSCHTPYCMDGCPVDAIHRRGNHLEIVIENHCIGCGLCERNCPYGAIHMVPRDTPNAAATALGGNSTLTAARRAVNCDLCNGGEPYCVEACPHEAAFRMSGPALLDEVVTRMADPR